MHANIQQLTYSVHSALDCANNLGTSRTPETLISKPHRDSPAPQTGDGSLTPRAVIPGQTNHELENVIMHVVGL